ncbi:MAG: hypothetical protein JNL83_11720 [Myxococcales bacterium]|nr:hypothetical protein [Myxococcales bacterium]
MTKRLLPALILAAASAPALADDVATGTAETPATDTATVAGSDTAVATIEPSRPAPMEPAIAPATTSVPPAGILDQNAATGEPVLGKGLREVGVSGGLMMSAKFRTLSIAPQIGWFFSDNMSLSAVVSLTNVEANEQSATTYAVLAEPAYHVPVGGSAFGFLGMGVGAAYIDTIGLGLAIQPRLGVKIRIGERGFLVPALQYSYISRSQMTENDIGTSSLTSAMMMSLGYNSLW